MKAQPTLQGRSLRRINCGENIGWLLMNIQQMKDMDKLPFQQTTGCSSSWIAVLSPGCPSLAPFLHSMHGRYKRGVQEPV